MPTVYINDPRDTRYLLLVLADAWAFGAQARALRKPCGMTGALAGDRRVLNESAAQMAGPNFERALALCLSQPRPVSR